MQIQPGQTYRSADPRELIRIRIKTYTPGENRALVVDAATGKRPRPMLVTALHTSPTTQSGKPRRSGYVLEQPETPAARQTTGQDDTDPTTADDPTPLRWGLGDVEHGDDDSVTVYLSGPDREPYWLELDPDRRDALCNDLAPLETHVVTDDSDDPEHTDDCPGCEDAAVGQPAEAHDTSVWTPANLHFLRFALGCAAAVMYSEDDFTEEDYAALDQLRAFAGPSPEDQAAETLAAADTVEDER